MLKNIFSTQATTNAASVKSLTAARNLRRAFTLIELLVVIGIIGILAAVSFPVFGTVQERGRNVRCIANLKQQGAGIHLFVAENNYFPPAQDPWIKDVLPYCQQNFNAVRGAGNTSKTTIFQCPSEKDLVGALYYTYAESNDARTDGSPADAPNPLRMAQLSNPAEYALVTDSYGKYYLAASNQSQLTTYGVTRRHNGRPNILYADGHAASYAGKLLGYKEDDGTGFYSKMWHWNGLNK